MGIAYIWSLRRLCNMIEQILSNKYDCNIVVEGKRGCLSGDTMIKTESGDKKIDDIKDGEKLWSYDFKNNKSILMPSKKIYSGIKDLYEIKTEDGRIIKSTLNHIFYVKRKDKIIELKLSDIHKGDKLISLK